MPDAQPREIPVFIASPGDLAAERKTFKDTVDALNQGFGDGAGVRFVPLGWEEVLATTGRRAQDVINKRIERSQLFILALHRRWGRPADGGKASSYTEEEFQLALRLWKKRRSPEIFVFFKNIDEASMADPGRQLKKVLEFRKKLEEEGKTLFRPFGSEVEFGKLLDEHLRAYARGEWNDVTSGGPRIELTTEDVSAVDQATRKAARRMRGALARKRESRGRGRRERPDLSLAEDEQAVLALARAAVDATNAGRLQDAMVLFSKATEGTTNLAVLTLAADFFRKIGDVENATSLVRRQSSIARDRKIAARHYLALVPKELLYASQTMTLDQMLAETPEELAGEIRAISEEVWGGGRLEKFLLEVYTKHFSTAELVAMTRYLATPEAQSILQKTPLMMAEAMEHGRKEFVRILEERHPGTFAPAEDPQRVAEAPPLRALPSVPPGETDPP